MFLYTVLESGLKRKEKNPEMLSFNHPSSIASITKGKLNEKTCTELVISENCQKEKLAFDEYVVQKATQFQQKREIFNLEQKCVQYNVTLKRKSHEDRQWCIIQTFGFNSTVEIPRTVKDAFDDDDLGLLPQGS